MTCRQCNLSAYNAPSCDPLTSKVIRIDQKSLSLRLLLLLLLLFLRIPPPQSRFIRRLLLLLWSELQEFRTLLCLLASWLANTGLLVVALARLDCRSTCDGLGAEIWTVTLLGSGVDNGSVELSRWGRGAEGRGLVLLGWLVAAGGELGG